MCKIDLKDAYFSIPLEEASQEFVTFEWKNRIYQFLCLCFGLAPAHRIFTKIMKVPIALMRKLMIRLIIYLDDILIMAPSKKEAILARDTLIYVLQMLGFVINIKKSVLEPLQKIDFLGVEIDSVDMTTSLPQEKVELIRKHCQDIMGKENVSIRELTSLVGRLSSTAIAVLPAPLQYRYLQRNQIQALSKSQNFDSIIPLSPQAKGEITWWIENLSLSNGRSLLTVPAQLVISSDASLQGWGQHAQAKQQGVHGPD